MGIAAAAYPLNCSESVTVTAGDAASPPMRAMTSLRPANRTIDLMDIQPSSLWIFPTHTCARKSVWILKTFPIQSERCYEYETTGI